MINAKYKYNEEIAFCLENMLIRGYITEIYEDFPSEKISYRIRYNGFSGCFEYITITEDSIKRSDSIFYIDKKKEKIKISTVDDLLKLLPLKNNNWEITKANLFIGEEHSRMLLCNLDIEYISIITIKNEDLKKVISTLNLMPYGFDNLEYVEPKTIKSILEELWKHQKSFERDSVNYSIYIQFSIREINITESKYIDRVGIKYFDKKKLTTAIQELEEINADFDDVVKCIKEME